MKDNKITSLGDQLEAYKFFYKKRLVEEYFNKYGASNFENND